MNLVDPTSTEIKSIIKNRGEDPVAIVSVVIFKADILESAGVLRVLENEDNISLEEVKDLASNAIRILKQ